MSCSRTIFFYLLLGFLVSNLAAQHQQPVYLTKKYAPGDVKKDVDLFCKVTLAMHPVIGIYKPRSFYEQYFATLAQGIQDSLTEKELRLKLKLAVAELNCGHTEVTYSSKTMRELNRYPQNYSPVLFSAVNGKVYAAGSVFKRQDSIIRRGMEVARINGIPADSIIRHSLRFFSHDGFVDVSSKHYLQVAFNSFLLGLFGRPDTFRVELVKDGAYKTVTYAAVRLKKPPVLSFAPKNDSLFTVCKRAALRYRFVDAQKQTLLLDLDRFSHRKYPKAYRRIFRKMQRNNTQNLIVDLRNNGGGSLEHSYRLLSYLLDTVQKQTLVTATRNYPYRRYTRGNFWFKFTKLVFTVFGNKQVRNDTAYFTYKIKPRKHKRFDGKIYVLINGGSFSASCLVSAYLKSRKNVVFVGEETGGTYEGCNAGITPYYRLPATGLRVRMPAFRVNNDVCTKITGHGIIPDYPTQRRIEDLLQKKDVEMEKVLELIGQQGR